MNTDRRAECERFLPFATNFVEWLLHAAEQDQPSPSELLRLLADLQSAALRLPRDFDGGVDLTDLEPVERDPKFGRDLALRVCTKLPFNEYCAVFDPVAGDRESMLSKLDDDMGDIYNDLSDGILRCEAGQFGDALWEWQFSYWSHWGRHLTNAQVAVYSYLANGGEYVNE